MATQLASPQYEFKEHEAKKKAKLQKGHVHLQLDIGQSFAVQLLEKRTLKSSMKAEAEAKARDAKLKAEAEARMNAAPKGGDMLDMMDNVGDYSDEEDEDGFDFM